MIEITFSHLLVGCEEGGVGGSALSLSVVLKSTVGRGRGRKERIKKKCDDCDANSV